MGRYYSGDIDGKFWFAVQSSDAADRFGSTGTSHYLEYYFDESHLPTIKKELKSIEDELGDNLFLINDFFSKVNSYNDQIMEENGLPITIWEEHKKDYADYLLGVKIRDCIIENGECSFTAEL